MSMKKSWWWKAVILFVSLVLPKESEAAIKYNTVNPEAEVNGVLYRYVYYDYPSKVIDSESWDRFLLEYEREAGIWDVWTALKADMDKDDKKFYFYDGSSMPLTDNIVKILKANSFSSSTDDNASPYYTGDVWMQDYVAFPALPMFREIKEFEVTDIESGVFNEELTSIRTPRFVAIKTGMFENCTGLKSVRIGAAECVQKNAFKGCSALETVFIESAPYVYDKAFADCPNIKKVVMDADLPHHRDDDRWYYRYDEGERSPFDSAIYEQATLYVHEEYIEDFKNDPTWGKFFNIRDINEYYAGVEAVISYDTELQYQIYDVSGMLIKTVNSKENIRKDLPSGIYIIKSSNGTVKKEFIK